MSAIVTETTLFYGLIILLIVVIATLLFLLIHAGFFSDIEVKTCKPIIRDLKIAYKAAKGPYKESGTLFTEVHSLLPQYRCLGIYYDDPKKKEASRLRYVVGVILSEGGSPTNKEEENVLLERGYKIAYLPSIDYAVQTCFPFNSTLSIIIAIFRVYPILDEYINSRNLCAHPCIEVYDNKDAKIYFIAPLEKQADFYVPEVPVVDAEDENQGESLESDNGSQSNDASADESILASEGEMVEKTIGAGGLSISTEGMCSSLASHSGSEPCVQDPSGCSKKRALEEESDHTSSSFEEINETDASDARSDMAQHGITD